MCPAIDLSANAAWYGTFAETQPAARRSPSGLPVGAHTCPAWHPDVSLHPSGLGLQGSLLSAPLRDHVLKLSRRSKRLFANETTARVAGPSRKKTKTSQIEANAWVDRERCSRHGAVSIPVTTAATRWHVRYQPRCKRLGDKLELLPPEAAHSSRHCPFSAYHPFPRPLGRYAGVQSMRRERK